MLSWHDVKEKDLIMYSWGDGDKIGTTYRIILARVQDIDSIEIYLEDLPSQHAYSLDTFIYIKTINEDKSNTTPEFTLIKILDSNISDEDIQDIYPEYFI